MPRRLHHQQRDTLPLQLPDGRSIELLRVVDPRARRLRLLVSARGPRLTIPPGVPAAQVQHFLQQHLHWLADQLAPDPHAPVPTPLSPGVPAQIPLRGERLDVIWQQAPLLRIRHEAEQLHIDTPPQLRSGQLGRALHEFYLAQARADVGRWLPRYLAGLPHAPREWKIRPLSSLWGSLSAAHVVSLDLALILAPPPAFEYVLVHELCHLIHAHHAPPFWHEVELRFPHWRSQRHWLREHGTGIKQELRCLLSGP